jgi:carotenoid cleavage dioxygenase-like enzyme
VERCLNPYEVVEFPGIHPAHVGQSSTPAVYCASIRSIGGPILEYRQPVIGSALAGVTKLSLLDGSNGDVVDAYAFPEDWMAVSEPTVIPKTDGAGEYIVMVATNAPESGNLQSKVVILDGDALSKGPVWTGHLPQHMHYGLHSLYVNWESMV